MREKDTERIGNIHPGEVLLEDFINPLGITPYQVAKATGIPQSRLTEIIKGRRRITADTALRLGKYFNTSPQLWLGLQNDYDLEEEMEKKHDELVKIKPLPQPV